MKIHIAFGAGAQFNVNPVSTTGGDVEPGSLPASSEELKDVA